MPWPTLKGISFLEYMTTPFTTLCCEGSAAWFRTRFIAAATEVAWSNREGWHWCCDGSYTSTLPRCGHISIYSWHNTMYAQRWNPHTRSPDLNKILNFRLSTSCKGTSEFLWLVPKTNKLGYAVYPLCFENHQLLSELNVFLSFLSGNQTSFIELACLQIQG